MKQSSFIKINPADSVVVCLRPFKQGEIIEVDGKTITLLQDTPAGHKVLIDNAAEGTNILKYGYPIGHAKKDLKQGEWVNENNLKTNLAGTLEYTSCRGDPEHQEREPYFQGLCTQEWRGRCAQ